MKKPIVFAVLSSMLMLGLTGCKTDPEPLKGDFPEPTSIVVEANVTEQSTVAATATPTAIPTETVTPTPNMANKAALSYVLSDKYADLTNLKFAINGKTYLLGIDTLQKMIDEGVEFEDLSNAKNNIRPNFESETFGIKLGDEVVATVAVCNFTEENQTLADCPVCKFTLLLTDEVIKDKSILLNCPLDLTKEQLIANAGEPTNKDTVDNKDSNDILENYYYTTLSEKYVGEYGYYFEFVNDKLSKYTIRFM